MTSQKPPPTGILESPLHNSQFVLAMFWLVVVFQLTSLKYIWGLETLARVANLLALVMLSVYAIYGLLFRKFDRTVWYFFILPGLLVFAGMLLNITLNTILDLSVGSYYGLVLPWAAYLAIPMLLKKGAVDSESLWRQFYYFMVAAVVLGLSDYVSVFAGLSTLRPISTPGGNFLAGRFSLLYGLSDGTPHYRFYACFPEPGTLAMFLLPALAYAALHKKIVGAFILLVGFYFTDSLGGYISLLMLAVVLVFVQFKKGRFTIPAIIISLVVACMLWISFGDYITTTYEGRNESRTIREENFSNTATYLPYMIFNNPLGFRLAESSFEEDRQYNFGSNFTIGNALQFGGISAFLGYLTCVLVSLACAVSSLIVRDNSVREKIVFCSIIVLFPFIVQRTVVWDSALFAFLFAPSIIGVLQARRSRVEYRTQIQGQLA